MDLILSLFKRKIKYIENKIEKHFILHSIKYIYTDLESTWNIIRIHEPNDRCLPEDLETS